MASRQGTILITGATGFIGRRLAQRLFDEGYSVRCMVRHTSAGLPVGVETVQGDMLDPSTLERALTDIDTALYFTATGAYAQALVLLGRVHNTCATLGFHALDRRLENEVMCP